MKKRVKKLIDTTILRYLEEHTLSTINDSPVDIIMESEVELNDEEYDEALKYVSNWDGEGFDLEEEEDYWDLSNMNFDDD